MIQKQTDSIHSSVKCESYIIRNPIFSSVEYNKTKNLLLNQDQALYKKVVQQEETYPIYKNLYHTKK